MTPEQQSQFIRVMQFGAAVGLHNRFLCLEAFINAYPNERQQSIEALAAFERGCGMSPEMTESLRQMTDESYYDFVCTYCDEKRRNHKRCA